MQKKLKNHPLETECDRVIQDLGGDLQEIKEIFDTGIMYRALFDGIPIYIALPTYVQSQSTNILRIEFSIGSIPLDEIPRLLFCISLDLDMSRHYPLRVIPRTKNQTSYEIILQTVINVDLIQDGFVASNILYGVELTQYYQDEFLSQKKVS